MLGRDTGSALVAGRPDGWWDLGPELGEAGDHEERGNCEIFTSTGTLGTTLSCTGFFREKVLGDWLWAVLIHTPHDYLEILTKHACPHSPASQAWFALF